MYIPKHFSVTDDHQIVQFIKQNAFGQLVSKLDGKLFATHMPFMLSDDHKRLIGHIAKTNPQWQQLTNQDVLVTLQGPHAYVSPSWYSSVGVPTWNYQAVHIYGTAQCVSDDEQLPEIGEGLTKLHESGFASPWQPKYETGKLRGIVGIEITIREIQCKFKLSQNREPKERLEIAKQLQAMGNTERAEAMSIQLDKI